MQHLADILQRHSVDTSTLQPLFGTGDRTVYTLYGPGDTIIDLWPKLRDMVDETGYWPIVLGDDVSLATQMEMWQRPRRKSVEKILEAAQRVDVDEWLDSNGYGYEWDDEDYDEEDGVRGEWPDDAQPSSTFSVPMNYDGEVVPKLHMGFVPTKTGWEVPAILRFGGWNACPPTEKHCAMLRRWHAEYGFEPAVMTRDTIEGQVARPPATREDALALAHQQYIYCSDIVSQGTGTLDALAAGLLHGTVWYFWWD